MINHNPKRDGVVEGQEGIMSKREQVPVDVKKWVELIDLYVKQHRFPTRTAAVGYLVMEGLASERERGRFDDSEVQ